MSDKYYYKCYNCAKIYSSEFIEESMIYLCPDCGSAEKNMPLTGVLTVEYDYSAIKLIYSREDFLKLESGKIWSYPALWPLEFNSFDENLTSRLSLPNNQLVKYRVDNKLIMFFDETKNPTYSYKDRASILVALKAYENGINEIVAASTGNAGSSLAGICARMGIKSHIFVPKNIPEAKRIQIQSYGSSIYIVDGDYDEAFDLSLEIAKANKWYNRNTAFNPLTIEGKKSAAYDMFIQSGGLLPEIIFVPVGDGVIISGLYKGFTELIKLGWINKIPELIAVQAEGSSALVSYLSNGRFEYKPASTIADSISAGAPRNLFMAAEAITNSGGKAVSVSDEAILDAQNELSGRFGLLVEPSCSSTYAAYKHLADSFNNKKVMLLMTGSGLKDFESLKLRNYKTAVKSSDGWKKELIKN